MEKKIKQAVIIWTGYKTKSFPSRIDDEIKKNYGSKEGNKILNRIKLLEEEYYQSTAYQTASNLEEMAKISRQEFISNHPDLDQEIANAFAWCYTFDYK